MSMERTSYVIAGYDLTEYVTDKYDEWRWTYEGEEYICNQIKGNRVVPQNIDRKIIVRKLSVPDGEW